MTRSPFFLSVEGIDDASKGAILAAGSPAVADVLAERIEQVDRHGYTAAHDADHDPAELAMAAYCYATLGLNRIGQQDSPITALQEAQQYWPWMAGPMPAADARGNLVKAAALILATIDRLDMDRAPAAEAA